MRDGRTPAAVRPTAGRRAAIATLAIGALLLVAGLVATLSHAAVRRSGTNDVSLKSVVGTLRSDHQICQQELIPGGTAAVKASASIAARPLAALAVQVRDVSSGAPLAVGAGARSDGLAPMALHPASARDVAAQVCLRLRSSGRGAAALLYGSPIDPREPGATDGNTSLPGRIRFDYLRAGRPSWWSFAPTIAERLGRGRAGLGSAVAPIAALLVLTSIAAAAWLLVRES